MAGAQHAERDPQLGERGHKHVLVVPIAFTSDHIETLSELDREYGHLAEQVGITYYRRTPALNARPDFLDALADVVHRHLDSGVPYGTPVSAALSRLHQSGLPRDRQSNEQPAIAQKEARLGRLCVSRRSQSCP